MPTTTDFGDAFGGRDQVLQVLVRRIRTHRDAVAVETVQRDRHELVESEIEPARRRHDEETAVRDRKHHVRIAPALRDVIRRDGVRAAGFVDDGDRLRKQLLAIDDVDHVATEEIGAASGIGMHDHFDRLGGEGLRLHGRGEQQSGGQQ